MPDGTPIATATRRAQRVRTIVGSARSANAVAAEPVTLLLIPSNRLEHLVRSNPALAIAIIKQLATRMLEAEDRARAAEERLRAAEERARAAEDRLKGSA